GINFYGTRILMSESDQGRNRINGQTYLNIESRFCIFSSLPIVIPESELEIEKLDWIEEAKLICELRLKRIINIRLDKEVPHLYIHLDSGEVLFIFGHNEKYECWQLGVWNNDNENKEVWEVIACPGNNIATWVPKDIVS
ncbi:hypothetical protein, partial [Cohnella sp. WQ 127256]|uniref:hypothetical protein n=1 Tax=Cohnella sp. WQ 127256 TaxID=2938790 RepID=UPI002118B2A8